MALSMRLRVFRFHRQFRYLVNNFSSGDNVSTTGDSTANEEVHPASENPAKPQSKFVQAFEKLTHLSLDKKPEKDVPFGTMLRHSKLIQLGDPDGKVVIGTISHVVADDLYIDFGGKFPCVCKCPPNRELDYKRGTTVKVRLHDLEMSSRFLGATKDITLLEADATLVGLYKPTTETDTQNIGKAS